MEGVDDLQTARRKHLEHELKTNLQTYTTIFFCNKSGKLVKVLVISFSNVTNSILLTFSYGFGRQRSKENPKIHDTMFCKSEHEKKKKIKYTLRYKEAECSSAFLKIALIFSIVSNRFRSSICFRCELNFLNEKVTRPWRTAGSDFSNWGKVPLL